MSATRVRVAAGAALLDAYFGNRQNWVGRIDWNAHDQTGKNCIVNQLFDGNYQLGLKKLGCPKTSDGTKYTGLEHGFSRKQKYEDSATLSRVWREYLGLPAATPAPAPATPAAFDAVKTAKKMRDDAKKEPVFSALRDALNHFDEGTEDYDYVVSLLAERRSVVIARAVDALADRAQQEATLAAVNAADSRSVVLS